MRKNTSRRMSSTFGSALGCSTGATYSCTGAGAGAGVSSTGCGFWRFVWLLPRLMRTPAKALKYQSELPAFFELYLSVRTLALPSSMMLTFLLTRIETSTPPRPNGRALVPSQRYSRLYLLRFCRLAAISCTSSLPYATLTPAPRNAVTLSTRLGFQPQKRLLRLSMKSTPGAT